MATMTAVEGAHTAHQLMELAIEAVRETAAETASADMVAAGGGAGGIAHAIAGIGSMLAGPAIALAAGLVEIDHAWEEARRRGEEVDREPMWDAVLYCLGRVPNPDRPEVVSQIGTHARDGARGAATFERLRPHAFEQLRARVLTHHREGEQAVLLGRDRGPAFERRYAEDPIFRLGVNEARAAREADPAAFRERAEALRGMSAQLDDARRVATRA
jgi:hypothetical protein